MKNFYRVKAKCGHVGNNKYIPIDFYFIADNAKNAAQLCRNTPRVKHHHKDAIIETVEITKADYDTGIAENLKDPYLTVDNIQEQRRIADSIIDRIQIENVVEDVLADEMNINRSNHFIGKMPVNNPKKFAQRYQHEGILFDEFQNNIPTAFRNYCNSITGGGKYIKKINISSNSHVPLSDSLYSLLKDKSCKSPDDFVNKMKSFLGKYYKTCKTEESLEFGVVLAYYVFLLEKINENPSNDIEKIINTILKMVYRFKEKLDLEYFENCLFDYRACNFNIQSSEEMFAQQYDFRAERKYMEMKDI